MYVVDLRKRLQEEKCNEGGNVHAHFYTMQTMQEDLAALGYDLSKEDFTAMLLGSLSKSYNSYLSTISATLSVLDKKLSPDALTLSVIDKFNCRAITTCQMKNQGKACLETMIKGISCALHHL
jgi:hypothetical protein